MASASFLFYLLILQRKRKNERETSICYSTYLFIHWSILVCALNGARTATLAYQDDALTSRAAQPGPCLALFDVLCACAAFPGLADHGTRFVSSIKYFPIVRGASGNSLGSCCPLERQLD